jgi:hypothetical protein
MVQKPGAPLAQSRRRDLGVAILGILLVPTLWPLGFIGEAILFPGATDPLLGGLQYALYLPALIWLLTVLGVTLMVGKIFRMRITNKLFFITSTFCALTIVMVFSLLSAWNTYNLIGQHGVIYPDRFDIGHELRPLPGQAAFLVGVTLATTGAFVGAGAFRLFKSQPA